MASLDSLPADQRAVLQLVLQRGRSYDDIARLLSIDRAAVRQRALTALDAIGPETGVPVEHRALITDYLLGQLSGDALDETRVRLGQSPGERAWARVVASELGSLAKDPLPEIPTDAFEEPPAPIHHDDAWSEKPSAGEDGWGDAGHAEPGAPPTDQAPPSYAPPADEPPMYEPPADDEPDDEPMVVPAGWGQPSAASAQSPAPTPAAAPRGDAPPAGGEAPPPQKPRRRDRGQDGGDAGGRSSRRGGLILIGVVVIVVAVLAIVLIANGLSGGSSNSSRSSSSSSLSSTTSTAASSTTTSSSSTAAKVVAQINLTPPTSGSKAAGIAEVLKEGANDGIAIVGQNVPPNTTKPPNAYAVWLYNSSTDAHLLGFVNPGVGSNGRLSTAGGLPANAAHFKQLIVTVETQANPKTPGTIILQGNLTGLS
jgi:hypothetical protein